MPLYVSMKDQDGYVVLLNKALLGALKNKILESAPDKTISPVVHMRKMNNGRGPLDKDLYDSYLADEYIGTDNAIKAEELDYIRNQKNKNPESAQNKTISPVVHMRKMNNGRGPLDKDLYDSYLADEYIGTDNAIKAAALDYIRNQRRIEDALPGSITAEDRGKW